MTEKKEKKIYLRHSCISFTTCKRATKQDKLTRKDIIHKHQSERASYVWLKIKVCRSEKGAHKWQCSCN